MPEDQPLVRTGQSLLEQRACASFQRHSTQATPSLLIQMCLWPQSLADWSRAQGYDSPAMVYNLLRGHKPYRRVRAVLAETLGVEDHALMRALVAHWRRSGLQVDPGASPPEGAADDVAPAPLAAMASARVFRCVAALPASTVLGFLLLPSNLTQWAIRHGYPPSLIHAVASGVEAPRVLETLAATLETTAPALHDLIHGARLRPPTPAAWRLAIG